jgi:hypothetical protein
MTTAAVTKCSRGDLLRRGLRLEYLTVGWNFSCRAPGLLTSQSTEAHWVAI